MPQGDLAPAAPEVTRDVFDWIFDFILRPHPMLGRKGAVCPFMDAALRSGGVSIKPIAVDGHDALSTVRAAAVDAISRVAKPGGGGTYEAVLFLPFGADEALCRRVTTEVQRDLRATAIDRGTMIGTFHPGHPEPGIRNPRFRPLDSPRPLLGIRTMVDTDIHFLAAAGPPPADRARAVEAWRGFFADRAPRALVELSARSLAQTYAAARSSAPPLDR